MVFAKKARKKLVNRLRRILAPEFRSSDKDILRRFRLRSSEYDCTLALNLLDALDNLKAAKGGKKKLTRLERQGVEAIIRKLKVAV